MIKLERSEQHVIPEDVVDSYGITPLQKTFIEEYLTNGMNATKAAMVAIQTNSPETYEKNINRKGYFSMRGAKMGESPTVKKYIFDHKGIKAGVTVKEVIKVLETILHDEEEETKNRIKSAELLLKHLNGFRNHNESKAPKSLTVISNMSEKDIDRELEKLIGSPVTELPEAEVIEEDEDEEDEN